MRKESPDIRLARMAIRQQRFSWDARKNRINIAKHHISFVRAAKIFDGRRVEKEDTRQDYGEERMLALRAVKR